MNQNDFTTFTEKFPHIGIVKVTNGYLVGIFPENKDVQKMMSNYVKEIMSSLQNMIQNEDGEQWKQKIQSQIDDALSSNNDDVKIFVCKNALEVMSYIAPAAPESLRAQNKPNLDWFWGDNE